ITETEGPVGAVVIAEDRERVVPARETRRSRLSRPCLDQRAVADAPAAVDRISLILVVGAVTEQRAVAASIDDERADRRAIRQFLIHARHGVVVARGEAVDILGAHAQQADVRPRADLAGEPQTSFDGRRCAGGDADAPRKEELDFLWRANGELAGVLEEEGALL